MTAQIIHNFLYRVPTSIAWSIPCNWHRVCHATDAREALLFFQKGQAINSINSEHLQVMRSDSCEWQFADSVPTINGGFQHR